MDPLSYFMYVLNFLEYDYGEYRLIFREDGSCVIENLEGVVLRTFDTLPELFKAYEMEGE